MPFINMTESIGIIIGSATTTTTGSLYLTLLLVIVIIMAVAMLFNIRLEFTSIVILPMILGYTSYYSEFVTMLLLLLTYFAMLITKNFLFK